MFEIKLYFASIFQIETSSRAPLLVPVKEKTAPKMEIKNVF